MITSTTRRTENPQQQQLHRMKPVHINHICKAQIFSTCTKLGITMLLFFFFDKKDMYLIVPLAIFMTLASIITTATYQCIIQHEVFDLEGDIYSTLVIPTTKRQNTRNEEQENFPTSQCATTNSVVSQIDETRSERQNTRNEEQENFPSSRCAATNSGVSQINKTKSKPQKDETRSKPQRSQNDIQLQYINVQKEPTNTYQNTVF